MFGSRCKCLTISNPRAQSHIANLRNEMEMTKLKTMMIREFDDYEAQLEGLREHKAELKNDIEGLQEKLTAERLSRAQAKKELQKLHTIMEEDDTNKSSLSESAGCVKDATKEIKSLSCDENEMSSVNLTLNLELNTEVCDDLTNQPKI